MICCASHMRAGDWGAMADAFTYDAIIIGSGLGGSTLAWKLAREGLRVLVVERGRAIENEIPKTGEAPGRYMYHMVGPTDPLSFVGGATKFYGAALYRMRESDFEETQHEAGISPAWPISYADLEPYYAEGERLFRVHGSSEGDPSEPPRSGDYPHPPLPDDPLVAKLAARLRASGTPVAPIPRGLDQGPDRPCRMCATCDAHVCRLDSKMDAEIAALRPALATGNVTLLTQADCLRVLTDEAGERVTGVLLSLDGQEQAVEAGLVAVACGIPGSATLLRKSRTSAHPEGLGNNRGALGRYLGGHHSGVIFPIVGMRPIGARHTKTIAINAFYHGDESHPAPLGVIQIAGQMPIWEGTSRLARPAVKAVATRSLTCFYMTEAVPTREAGLVFEGDRVARRVLPPEGPATFAMLRERAVAAFRKAGYRVLPRSRCDLWHEVGTARMGSDPATSVVDPDCMVHGIEGLYVVDASVLPSAGAVNTGLTILALALRAGAHIAGKTRSAAKAVA